MQLMSWNNKIFLVTLPKFTVNNKSYHCHVFGLQRYITSSCLSVKKHEHAICNIVSLNAAANEEDPFLEKIEYFTVLSFTWIEGSRREG